MQPARAPFHSQLTIFQRCARQSCWRVGVRPNRLHTAACVSYRLARHCILLLGALLRRAAAAAPGRQAPRVSMPTCGGRRHPRAVLANAGPRVCCPASHTQIRLKAFSPTVASLVVALAALSAVGGAMLLQARPTACLQASPARPTSWVSPRRSRACPPVGRCLPTQTVSSIVSAIAENSRHACVRAKSALNNRFPNGVSLLKGGFAAALFVGGRWRVRTTTGPPAVRSMLPVLPWARASHRLSSVEAAGPGRESSCACVGTSRPFWCFWPPGP